MDMILLYLFTLSAVVVYVFTVLAGGLGMSKQRKLLLWFCIVGNMLSGQKNLHLYTKDFTTLSTTSAICAQMLARIGTSLMKNYEGIRFSSPFPRKIRLRNVPLYLEGTSLIREAAIDVLPDPNSDEP